MQLPNSDTSEDQVISLIFFLLLVAGTYIRSIVFVVLYFKENARTDNLIAEYKDDMKTFGLALVAMLAIRGLFDILDAFTEIVVYTLIFVGI